MITLTADEVAEYMKTRRNYVRFLGAAKSLEGAVISRVTVYTDNGTIDIEVEPSDLTDSLRAAFQAMLAGMARGRKDKLDGYGVEIILEEERLAR